MTDHRATYAARFARVAIERPRPPMTDAEWVAWVETLEALPQAIARFSRALSSSFARSPSPRSVAFVLRPH